MKGNNDGGKGSRRRIQFVSNESFCESFDRIFGGTLEKTQRSNVDGTSHCGDDVRTETNGSDVQPLRKSGG